MSILIIVTLADEETDPNNFSASDFVPTLGSNTNFVVVSVARRSLFVEFFPEITVCSECLTFAVSLLYIQSFEHAKLQPRLIVSCLINEFALYARAPPLHVPGVQSKQQIRFRNGQIEC